MKVLLVVFLICVPAFCVADGFFYRPGKSVDFKSLEKAIRNKCVTEDNFSKLQYELDEFARCVSRVYQNQPDQPDPFNSFDINEDYCSYFNKTRFSMCLEKFTTNILPCLDENEMYLQQFIIDAFDVALEELCGINGMSNIRYLYDKVNRTLGCLQICQVLALNYGSCDMANLNIFKHLDKGVLNLSKHNVCSDLESYRKCTVEVTEGICNEEYSRFMDLVFHPFLQGCNDLNNTK